MSKLNFTVHTMHMITEEPVSSKVTPFLDARSYGSLSGILNVFFSDLVESFHRKKEDLTYEQLLISHWYEKSSLRLSESTTLKMTSVYLHLSDSTIRENFDSLSPVSQLKKGGYL